MAMDQRVIGLALLVLAAAAGVYVFFQNAPDAHLCVSSTTSAPHILS